MGGVSGEKPERKVITRKSKGTDQRNLPSVVPFPTQNYHQHPTALLEEQNGSTYPQMIMDTWGL